MLLIVTEREREREGITFMRCTQKGKGDSGKEIHLLIRMQRIEHTHLNTSYTYTCTTRVHAVLVLTIV